MIYINTRPRRPPDMDKRTGFQRVDIEEDLLSQIRRFYSREFKIVHYGRPGRLDTYTSGLGP